jgi:hypothetical protein
MSVSHAIRKAERVLPGKKAPEGKLDPRWQAIIGVADHIERHPDEVWCFTRRWGSHANADLRAAVATCLLEHLLEYHFERIFPLVSEGCIRSRRFADTFSRCGEFGQTSERGNLQRFRGLKRRVSGLSANKHLQPTPR